MRTLLLAGALLFALLPASPLAAQTREVDANQCVTEVETKLNATFQGNTSASVMNGCGRPVDVRICLMAQRSSGGEAWNCGLDLAVDPQEAAVHSSFRATGPVFVDARFTGSGRRLADPPGYRS